MIKKLLIALVITLSASLLNAADTTKQEEDFFAGVKQLNEEQMQSVTGEDIQVIEYRIIGGSYIQVVSTSIVKSDTAEGYIKINIKTGATEINVYPIEQ